MNSPGSAFGSQPQPNSSKTPPTPGTSKGTPPFSPLSKSIGLDESWKRFKLALPGCSEPELPPVSTGSGPTSKTPATPGSSKGSTSPYSPSPLSTSVGVDESWTSFKFTSSGCSEPDHISSRFKEAVRINNLPKIPKQDRKPLRTSMEVALENVLKKEEAAKNKTPESKLPRWFRPSYESDYDVEVSSERKDNSGSPGLLIPLSSKEKRVLEHEIPGFVNPLGSPFPASKYWSRRLLNDVIVHGITSPSDFYVRNYETRKDLEFLENAMYNFYQPYWKVSELLTPGEIMLGGFYAVYVLEKDKWFRGRAISLIGRPKGNANVEVLVQLVDHGTYAVITLECIFPLRQLNTQLPIQAAWATLNIVDFYKRTWSDEQKTKFKKDAEGKLFLAFVKKIGDCPERHMPIVKLVLTHQVDAEEKVYTLDESMDAVVNLFPRKNDDNLPNPQ